MTDSNDNPYLGERHVWVVCTAPGQESCTNHIPEDPDQADPYVADWGSATAAWGSTEQYQVFGKRISALLIERILDPDWVEDPDDDDQLPPEIVERVIPTWTKQITVDTPTPELIYPAIELYDGIPENGEQSVAGIIDGTYYVYVVVFPDSRFCYLPRCSGTYEFGGEVCNQDFPLEPYDPNCNPPVYPMDSITSFVPSSRVVETIEYNATWEYYRLDTDPDKNNLLSTSLKLNMTVYAPSNDWQALMQSAMELTYFYNGIYH